MSDHITDQESFWRGSFGNEYIARNLHDEKKTEYRIKAFDKILKKTSGIQNILELGANVGGNLKALHELLPNSKMTGLEINLNAANEMSKLPSVRSVNESVLNWKPDQTFDLVFTWGVLIHIDPSQLNIVYDLCHQASNKYILFCEYYNPSPIEVPYRGHTNCLFKRDFAGEFIDRFSMTRVLDYKFFWQRDLVHPQDDVTCFLIEKESR